MKTRQEKNTEMAAIIGLNADIEIDYDWNELMKAVKWVNDRGNFCLTIYPKMVVIEAFHPTAIKGFKEISVEVTAMHCATIQQAVLEAVSQFLEYYRKKQ